MRSGLRVSSLPSARARAAVACSAFLFAFLAGCAGQPPEPAKHTLKASEAFRDGELSVAVQKVAPRDASPGSVTLLVLNIDNHSTGVIYHLPLWDEKREAARITDEHGNHFAPTGERYYRNPRGKNSPPANGNRVDPGANDVLVIECASIPASSKRLTVELPYKGSVIVFADVPHGAPLK